MWKILGLFARSDAEQTRPLIVCYEEKWFYFPSTSFRYVYIATFHSTVRLYMSAVNIVPNLNAQNGHRYSI